MVFVNFQYLGIQFIFYIQTRFVSVTRGQRPNESQKAVIIDVKESVGGIAFKIWPVV